VRRLWRWFLVLFVWRAAGESDEDGGERPPRIVPEGPPMVLWGTGTHKRQGLALILHDSTRPMTAPATDWTPTGLCTVK